MKDTTESKHKGNPQSVEAFREMVENLPEQRQRVWKAIGHAGKSGISAKELALSWGVGMNVISGRFTELKRMGLIYQVGIRNRSAVMVKLEREEIQ